MAKNPTLREDGREIVQGAKALSHGIASGYRNTTDWAKPSIDKGVDSLAFLIGANTAVAATIYAADRLLFENGIQSVFGPEAYTNLQQFLSNHPVIETGLKGALYTAAYGWANVKAIWPVTKRIFNRTTTPSWRNHAKTWGIAAATYAAIEHGALEPANGTLRTIDNYLSGKKAAEVGSNVAGTAQTLVQEGKLEAKNKAETLDELIDAFSFGAESDVSKSVEGSLNEADERNPRFDYGDRVSKDARRLKGYGMDMTPEELVYLTRAVYFEGGFDRNARTDRDLKRGMQAITAVMHNRWKYDNMTDERYGRRDFGKGGDSPFDVAFRHTKKRRKHGRGNYTVWQFTCVRDHPEYFHEHKGKRGWDMYGEGKLNIAVGQMDRHRAALAYEAVIGVLTEEAADPTKGALFYQNPRAVDRNNTPEKWRKRGLRETTTVNSHVFYTYRNGGTGWQKNMNIGELEQERANVRHASYEPKKPAYRGV